MSLTEESEVTMVDVLEQQTAAERDAHAVLGGSDDNECTYDGGYVRRQALYACLTCCPAGCPPAGVCLACSLSCHEHHELVELYTKRNFRCDCGGPSFEKPCTFGGKRDTANTLNKYNHNFAGLYCRCDRPYPDPDATTDDDMIQCVICEDWLHAGHLNARVPHNDRYAEMVCDTCVVQNEFLKDYIGFAVTTDDDDTINETVNVTASDTTLDTTAEISTIPIIQSVVSTQDASANNGLQKIHDGFMETGIVSSETECVPKIVEVGSSEELTRKENENHQENDGVTNNPDPNTSGSKNADLPNSENLDLNNQNLNTPSDKCTTEETHHTTLDNLLSSSSMDGGEPDDSTSTTLPIITQPVASGDLILKDSLPLRSDSVLCTENVNSNESDKVDSTPNEVTNREHIAADGANNLESPIENVGENNLKSPIKNDIKNDDNLDKTTDTDDKNVVQVSTDSIDVHNKKNDEKMEVTDVENNLEISTENDNVTQDNKMDVVKGSNEKVIIENDSTYNTNIVQEKHNNVVDINVQKDNVDTTQKIDTAEAQKCKENGFNSTENGNDFTGCKNDENSLKRRIDTSNIKTEPIDESSNAIKKLKMDNCAKCIRPTHDPPVDHKGALFWPNEWRTKLCTCPVCVNMYKENKVTFLLETDDTVVAYENLGKMKTSSSQYEKGLEALSSLGRIQQINAITEYNKMKEKLLEFLKTFKDKREVVREEDIKGFFAGMKPKREPDGVYFCR